MRKVAGGYGKVHFMDIRVSETMEFVLFRTKKEFPIPLSPKNFVNEL